jgi:hypothetical protein
MGINSGRGPLSVEINDPTHLTGHVCVDASRDEEKYQDFTLSGCPEEDRRGDRHLSGTCQRLCVGIYHVIYYVMNDTDNPFQSQPSEGGGSSLFVGGGWTGKKDEDIQTGVAHLN